MTEAAAAAGPQDPTRALELELAEADPVARRSAPTALLAPASLRKNLLDAAGVWAVILGCWLGMALGPAPLYPLWALLIGGRLNALGVILHELCHMPPQRSAEARLLEVLAGWPIMSTVDAMRYHHLRHHRDSGMPTDPYLKPPLVGRPLLRLFYWQRTGLLIFVWTLRALVGSLAATLPSLRGFYARGLLQDRSGAPLTDHPEVIRCAVAERRLLLPLALLALVGLASPGALVYGVVIPAWVAGLLCGWRLLEEHSDARATDRRVETILRTTRDHNLDPLGQLLFAPLNVGYHVVHHLHPQAAKEGLPALAAWYRAAHPAAYPRPRRWWGGDEAARDGV
ncbi:fatty acid desaturase [Myxococcota bacterium]|nr:fatty acid desaturase [Myxococcota bacterium]